MELNPHLTQTGEKISKEIRLKDKTITAEINFFHEEKDRDWALHVLNLASEALPLLENISGTPYSRDYGIKIYEATSEDLGRNDGENREKDGIWIKPQAQDSYIVHEIAHCFTDFSDESWIMEGLAELYTYIVFKELNRPLDSGIVKGTAFSEYYKYLKFEDDFPLDGWDPMTAERSKAYYGYGKSFVFMYSISQKYGIEALKKANRSLYDKGVKASSEDYKNALEEACGISMDDVFSGWIFPGDIMLFSDEVKKVEKYCGGALERKIIKKIFEKF